MKKICKLLCILLIVTLIGCTNKNEEDGNKEKTYTEIREILSENKVSFECMNFPKHGVVNYELVGEEKNNNPIKVSIEVAMYEDGSIKYMEYLGLDYNDGYLYIDDQEKERQLSKGFNQDAVESTEAIEEITTILEPMDLTIDDIMRFSIESWDKYPDKNNKSSQLIYDLTDEENQKLNELITAIDNNLNQSLIKFYEVYRVELSDKFSYKIDYKGTEESTIDYLEIYLSSDFKITHIKLKNDIIKKEEGYMDEMFTFVDVLNAITDMDTVTLLEDYLSATLKKDNSLDKTYGKYKAVLTLFTGTYSIYIDNNE